MTANQDFVGRRRFLRVATRAALSVLATGALALFGASTASASHSESCCHLWRGNNAWCPLLCRELNHSFRCWTCNNSRCRCCECSTGPDCFSQITVCSYQHGCCVED